MKTKNTEHTPSRKTAVGIRFLALALALVLAGSMLFPMGRIAVANAAVNTILSGKSISSKVPSNEPASHDASTEVSTGSRILKNFPMAEELTVAENGNTYVNYLDDESYAFGTRATRQEILSITLLNTLKNAPEDAVDASEKGDRSVLAWVVPNEEYYDLYIAANGTVYAPENSEYLFSNFYNMEHMDIRNLDTSKVRDMHGIFDSNYELTELDLSHFNTTKVESMAGMFFDCANLKSLDLSSFDTSRVYNMNSMFSYCESLRSLDLSNFDTYKLGFMHGMFKGCTSLSELDLSSFDTSIVVMMDYTFYNTPRLKNVTGNFDFRVVEEYNNFMDEGDTFNGQPWEELFP